MTLEELQQGIAGMRLDTLRKAHKLLVARINELHRTRREAMAAKFRPGQVVMYAGTRCIVERVYARSLLLAPEHGQASSGTVPMTDCRTI